MRILQQHNKFTNSPKKLNIVKKQQQIMFFLNCKLDHRSIHSKIKANNNKIEIIMNAKLLCCMFVNGDNTCEFNVLYNIIDA